jgi:hypothetical protein
MPFKVCTAFKDVYLSFSTLTVRLRMLLRKELMLVAAYRGAMQYKANHRHGIGANLVVSGVCRALDDVGLVMLCWQSMLVRRWIDRSNLNPTIANKMCIAVIGFDKTLD